MKQYLFIYLSIAILTSASVEAQPAIRLDMSDGWMRRDWYDCQDASQMTSDARNLTIATEKSAALYWQVPTTAGPIRIDEDLDWVQKCDRPPRDFAKTVADGPGRNALLNVTDYRYFSWKWNISNTIDDKNTIDSDGRIQKEGDDFAAKIGIAMLKKDSNELRELSYVWTRNLPEEKLLVHETRILFWKFKYHRIVAQSGETGVGQWVSEARDLYADYKRIYPNEEPGKIVRIYVMSDSDNTESKVTGTFADLAFQAERPRNISPSE